MKHMFGRLRNGFGLALVICAAPAFAIDTPQLNLSNLPGGGPPCFARGITVPPPQFDHPAKGEKIVRFGCGQVKLICEGQSACALVPTPEGARRGIKCEIVIPIEMGNSGWEFEYTLRHERGHCNSGSTDHAGYSLPPGL